jgi:hypothetical protein
MFKIGSQMATDLAVAWIEGEETAPGEATSHSRRFRKAAAGLEVHVFVLPANKKIRLSESPASQFKHRAEAIRRKGLELRPEVVQAYVALFHAVAAKDMPALLYAYLRLFPKLFAKAGPPQKK